MDYEALSAREINVLIAQRKGLLPEGSHIFEDVIIPPPDLPEDRRNKIPVLLPNWAEDANQAIKLFVELTEWQGRISLAFAAGEWCLDRLFDKGKSTMVLVSITRRTHVDFCKTICVAWLEETDLKSPLLRG